MKIFNLENKRIKVLIFDIDSTLYTCPEYAHEQIDSQVRHFAEIRGISHDEARKMVADFRRQWAREHEGEKISLGNLLTHYGIPIETSVEWRKELFDPAKYLSRDERLIESLEKLSKKYSLICVTNNPVAPALRTLEVLGVDSLIPDIIGLDTCYKSKPAVEPFRKAVNLVSKKIGGKIEYSECLSVGDRFDIDLKLPIEMGMAGILVTGVEEVYSLPEIL